MKKEIKELKAELLKVFSKFEENECEAKTVLADEDEEGWYINEKGSLGLHKHGQKTSAYLVYDLTFYNDRTYLYSKLNGTWRKATESEVKEAFTNYFRSKGWVSGKTKFKSAAGGEFTYKEPLTFYDGNIVSDSSGCLFSKATITLATKIEEEIIKLIAGRIEDEMRKHPTLEWQKIAASKIYSQWFEFLNNENQELKAKVRELEAHLTND